MGAAWRGAAPAWRPAILTRLLATTALRYFEGAGLKWSEVDWPNAALRLEQSKTGRSTRALSKEAMRLLERIPQTDPWVFPNNTGTGPASLKKPVTALFDEAGLDARSHDLRRSFASIAAEVGYSNSTIAELLGHARRGVISRHYIRRPDAVLVAAADKISETIARMLDGESGEVVEGRKWRK